MTGFSTRIKICGLKDPELAYKAAKEGADYIGIMFYPKSKRVVELATAIEIAKATKKAGAQPVAVFVDHCADKMLEICETADIQIAQLHGEISRREHQFLPEEIKRIYVLHVNNLGEIVNGADPEIKLLKAQRDYFLFDGLVGGMGKQIKIDCVGDFARRMRFFIAGGLNKDNVGLIIDRCKPYGVDVSSGVEDEKGNKSLALISEFIVN